ncbi:Fe2+ transport system protein A [Xenococcus sp. PCC 7305]|uniref:FeoA family protein n=1 Tax=Xenococcus sp. PCC 7305 TaxID=102125 RepID=UPI0002ACB729|nr:FeoA family protein [Xenococcus sp. PCC 7305]ELS00739.1 Fe2+ transport system protein A [Xenococcus sp. PCC 7305]
MLTQGFTVQYSPLDFLATKTQGVIMAIRNKDERVVKKLLAMGVHKGMHITLEQRFPSFLIKVGRTRIAIDRDIARSIKVRVIGK